MPTITLQVGQCGNQLGFTLWDLLQQQQSQCSSDVLVREWFATVPQRSSSGGLERMLRPRCVCIDSEAKVVQHWQGSPISSDTVHMLGRGGGCGNNWSCGYQLALKAPGSINKSAWSAVPAGKRCIDQVLEGIRREAEQEAGVPDFLQLSSLAGGTGSGFGSALLEALADEFPCSTIAAVAVAPGRSGGSDTATQSINCCLALQHAARHAHVVLLLDNQVLMDRLNSSLSENRAGGRSRAHAGAAAAAATSRAGMSGGSRRSTLPGASAAVSGRACLQGVNELAAQALLGLLWPLSEGDQLARRTSIRQLGATVAADPVAKLLEVCHVGQPDADLPVNITANNPWPARLKLLAAQLPAFDPFCPTQPVSTAAACVVARGGLCKQSARATGLAARVPSVPQDSSFSCWSVLGAVGNSGGSDGGSRSAPEAAMASVVSTWPHWQGSTWDVCFGDAPAPLWDTSLGKCASSLTAAVRRSSTGSFLRDVSAKCCRLSDAGAYMHWYQQYGTEPAEIRDSATALEEMAEAY